MAITASYCNRTRKSKVNLRLIALVVFCVAATLIICCLSVAGRPQGRREIVSDDFTNPRPTPTPRPAISGREIIALKLPPSPGPVPVTHYRFAASTSPNAPPLPAADNVWQLGLTLWRLRPAGNIETGQRMLVKENNNSAEWIPERIEMDTPLSTGDRVRLSIESPRQGYLYVIDRDLYAHGKTGDARLLFPTRSVRGGDNQVRPGKLIDLPQEDQPNYFTAKLGRSDQVGEILTIIVATAPLMSIGDQPLVVPAADLAQWEKAWASETERFEMVGGAGKSWTKEEKEASAATGSRQLTQDEPPPQTIYRIASTNKTAFLINVRLNYAR